MSDKPLDMEKIAKALGSEYVGKVKAGDGYFGALAVVEDARHLRSATKPK